MSEERHEALRTIKSLRLQWQTSLTHKFIDKLLEIDGEKDEAKKKFLEEDFEQYLVKSRRYSGRLFGIPYAIRVNKWLDEAKSLMSIQKSMMERYGIPMESRVLIGEAGEGLGREINDDVLIEQMTYYVSEAKASMKELVTTN